MEKCNSGTAKLSVCNLGMGLGITWSLSMAFIALASMWFGYGTDFVKLFSSVYIGFAATGEGVFLGLLWGFADGFIGGALIAFFYNLCRCKCPCLCCKKNRKTTKTRKRD